MMGEHIDAFWDAKVKWQKALLAFGWVELRFELRFWRLIDGSILVMFWHYS